MEPIDVLKNFYGYHAFRGNQEKIIQTALGGKDCIALMPTGAGKSVCYQVPAMLWPGLTLVVSPLIALMKDQVDGLNNMGIPAAFLNSTQSVSEQRFVSQEVCKGKVKLLYVAPERLFGGTYPLVDLLKSVDLSMVAVDEAHCVSQWGHDFRPEYLKLGELRKKFPSTVFLALTATADKMTRKDIEEKLFLQHPRWFISSFDRPNITYRVALRTDAFSRLMQFLSQYPNDSGIIYCLSRKSVEETAARLQENGYDALPYHAGLDKAIRDTNQEKFIRDEIKIMVATIAFGMGIDKSNVRFVVHTNMPQNIESYYQETGRAGRDGLPSEALLFYSYGDSITLGRMVEKSDNPEYVQHMKAKLDTMVRFCQSQKCRRRFLLEYFGEEYPNDCGNCDVCFQKGSQMDMTIYAQMMLSAVARMGQSFGLGQVILVLRGSRSAKINAGQQSLSVYGIGKDKSEQFWKKLGGQLVQEGFLTQEGQGFPVLKLTPLAWEKLKKKEKILLSMAEDFVQPQAETGHDKELFDRLKHLRFGLARKENVPPYMVFSDATLVEMATFYPVDEQSLFTITGVGAVKADRYGEDFLRLIRKYAEENGIQPKKKTVAKQARPRQHSGTEKQTLEYFRRGWSLEEVARNRGLALSTVESHLIQLAEKGEVDSKEILTDKETREINAAYLKMGQPRLKPLKEHFGEKYTYFQLRLALLVK
ncbi:DNA helicase RecQ [Negadavirga shengliensis]|uniref:DNA helicase RecQ n=1 Tax=Negadavirga shengliensis TaxID=1389218 RepID=A0ABV9SUY2_9BACT